MHFTGWKHGGLVFESVLWLSESRPTVSAATPSVWPFRSPENENQTALWDELADHPGYDAQEIHIQATFRIKPSPVFFF